MRCSCQKARLKCNERCGCNGIYCGNTCSERRRSLQPSNMDHSVQSLDTDRAALFQIADCAACSVRNTEHGTDRSNTAPFTDARANLAVNEQNIEENEGTKSASATVSSSSCSEKFENIEDDFVLSDMNRMLGEPCEEDIEYVEGDENV